MSPNWKRIVFYVYWWFCSLEVWANIPKSNGVTISRHFQGDMFFGEGEECSASYCTAQNRSAHPVRRGSCQCQCDVTTTIYRDDDGTCVDTIEECVLADYVNGATYEKVPFVFMPLKGQLINPSAEIALSDVRTEGQAVVSPVCVVSKAHYLTTSGWVIADNTSSVEPPFALYRERGKTYLQWLGDPRQRALLEGRIVLVRLLCKDTVNSRLGVFSPCVAFRVAGSPGLAESSFLGESKKAEGGLQSNDYLAIGISVGLLTILYILGIALCLVYRRRQRSVAHHKKLLHPGSRLLEEGRIRVNPLLQDPDNLMAQALRASFRQQQQHMGSVLPSTPNNNPRNGPRPSGDSRNSVDAPGGNFPSPRRQMTMAVVHPMEHNNRLNSQENPPAPTVATISTAKANMTEEEKRLYFNGTYLDPQLLKAPPPVALEFLSRIRGMIDIARTKIATKRFLPSLIDIPEEYQYGTLYAQRLAQQNTAYGNVSSSKLSQIDEDTDENVSQKSESKYSVRSTTSSSHKRTANEIYDSLKRGVASTFNQVMKLNRSSPKTRSMESLHKADSARIQSLEINLGVLEQKSPLPVRQSNSYGNLSNNEGTEGTCNVEESLETESVYAKIKGPSVSMYTNPSIDEIYGSLAKSKQNKPANSVINEEDRDSDVLSDILSEAESKVPKVNSDSGSNRSTLKAPQRSAYFEADSLERMYESRKRRKGPVIEEDSQQTPEKHLNSNEDNKTEAESPDVVKAEKKECFEYDSAASTPKSVKSLSQLCPGGEEMEASNALFNMRTGANTVHRAFKKKPQRVIGPKVRSLESVNRWNNDHIYEYVDEQVANSPSIQSEVGDDQSVMSLSSMRALPGSPSSQKSSNSSTTSVLTVLPGIRQGSNKQRKSNLSPSTSLDVHCDESSDAYSTLTRITVGEYEEVCPSKLTIEVDDHQNSQAIPINEEENFETDTLEKRPRGGANSKRLLRHESFTDSLERPKVKTPLKAGINPKESPISPASSSGVESSESLSPSIPLVAPSLSMLRELRERDRIISRQNLRKAREQNEEIGENGPPLSQKAQEYPTKVPTIYESTIPPPRPPKSEKVLANQLLDLRPMLPPKNGKEPKKQPNVDEAESGNAVAVQKAIEQFAEEPRKRVYNGQFILSTKQDRELDSPPSSRLSVLERIAALEREEAKIREESCLENSQGMTKGMEIALTLRARLGKDLEGTLKDRDRTRTIKKTWRRFLEKVEDSFSETDAPSSTNSSLVGTLRQIKTHKKRINYAKSDDDPQDDEQDSSPTSVRSWKQNRHKKGLEESKSTSSQTVSESSSSRSEQSVSDSSMTITSTLPTEFEEDGDLKADESDCESRTSLGSDGGASCSTLNSSLMLDRNSSKPSTSFRGILHINNQSDSTMNAKSTNQITLLAMKRLDETTLLKKNLGNDSFDSGLYSGAYSERANIASLF